MVIFQSCPFSSLFPLTICLSAISAALGCGQFPQGPVQATSFTVGGFTLSPEMVYSLTSAAHVQIPKIARDAQMARRFMENLVMNAVNEVLQEQGRNALLPDVVITLILQQLNVTINYSPLNCPTATADPANGAPNARIVMPDGCSIIGDVVSSLCTMADCTHTPIKDIKAVPSESKSFTGSVRTSNVIMANWSRQMWQRILNRVLQKLTSGSFQKYFSGAVVTVA